MHSLGRAYCGRLAGLLLAWRYFAIWANTFRQKGANNAPLVLYPTVRRVACPGYVPVRSDHQSAWHGIQGAP